MLLKKGRDKIIYSQSSKSYAYFALASLAHLLLRSRKYLYGFDHCFAMTFSHNIKDLIRVNTMRPFNYVCPTANNGLV